MRISTKGRYSLTALLYIALLDKGCFASAREIAGATGISEGYLEQLFIALRRAGIIQGARGPQGGYILEQPPHKISAGDVLRAVEGSLAPAECVSSADCPRQTGCRSRPAWDKLNAGIGAFVDSVSLADLVRDYRAHSEPEYAI